MIGKRNSVLISLLTFAGFWLLFFNLVSAQSSVTWQNPVNVSVSGNSITKLTPSTNGWDAGASSVQAIPGGNDGYVEFSLGINTFAGLSNGDSNANYPDIDFGIQAGPNFTNTLAIYENGIHPPKISGLPYSSSDIFRVAVESGVVKYYQNGNLLYTSSKSPTFPLLLDTSIYAYNSSVTSAVIVSSPIAGPPPPPGPQAAGVTIDNFDVVQKTIPPTASLVNFKLLISQQDQALSCPSGNLDWVVFEAATPNGYPQWIRDNTRDSRDTGLPLSPNPLSLDFNIPDFIFSNKLLTDQGYAFFRAVLGCNLGVGNIIYTNNLALSEPICVTIPGGKANCGGIAPGPGTDQSIKWGIFNPLIGRDPNQDVFDLIVIISNWILNIAGSLIIILIIYSGVRFLISRGNPGEIQKAKSILFWALAGFGVVLIGKGFIYLVESVLQGKIPIFS